MNITSDYRKAKICGIYQIRNLVNGKVYIGSSKGVECRFYEHKKDLTKNQHDNQYLQNSWNKHGEDQFVFEIIKTCEVDELIVEEQKLLDETKCYIRENGYNICEIANKPFMTKEVREKISNTLKGNTPWNVGIPHSDEAREKMRQQKLGIKGKDHSRFGKNHSDDSKEKIRQGNLKWLKENDPTWLGRKHSEETKEKIRNSRKKYNNPINQFKDDILINTFPTLKIASEITKIKSSSIRKCLNGSQMTGGGFQWEFTS